MKRVLLYPLWLRIWHWFNASLFIILIASGISMHYSNTNDLFLPFNIAMYTHNVAGILLSVIFIAYTIFNGVSGNYKHYIPVMKNIFERLYKQGIYYVYGVFKGLPHPYHTTEEMKFNPLQQLTYFSIMFFMMPLIIISGLFLMFPETAPKEVLDMGGVWPMAVLHIAVGYFLSLFMFGHIYLATHGEKISTNFKSMIDGYHEVHESENEAHEHEKDILIIPVENVNEYNEDTKTVEIHNDYAVNKDGDTEFNPETDKIKSDSKD